MLKASFRGERAFLSNFAPAPILYKGITYPTAEHAYQASKSLDEVTRRFIAKLPTPGAAKRYGKLIWLRPGWDGEKSVVMFNIVLEKFKQNPELAKKLIATGTDPIIEENYWHDTYWGTYDGQGENRLGKILMLVRHKLTQVHV